SRDKLPFCFHLSQRGLNWPDLPWSVTSAMIPTVTLPGMARPTTAVGFGCNSLLGPRSRREGLSLLAEAYEAGVRHFDVARAYSSGDAEGVLGEFLSTRRDSSTLTTKFGIQPPRAGGIGMRSAKAVARKLMRFFPRYRKALGARASHRLQGGAYSVEEARASLETSLRELRTERIEVFLAHEASASDCSPELAAYLLEEMAAGRIGAFGVGSGFDRVPEIVRERPEFAQVLQFNSGVVHRNLEALSPPSSSFTITYGAIGSELRGLRAYFEAHPDVVSRWSKALGLDLTDVSGTLAPLLLASSLHANAGGVVLFSSTRRKTIRENLRAIADERFPPDQLELFGTLSREAAQTPDME
ncbi:MAG TPA: aldo/keto reductase, partial [Isosphaeraceae bacterium]|nr:aldo/keto reductase [Isosphaeraceae bacterium]